MEYFDEGYAVVNAEEHVLVFKHLKLSLVAKPGDEFTRLTVPVYSNDISC